MNSSPLRITFVLPFLSMTGGIRVVFEHTRMLRRRGHQVRLVAPKLAPGPLWTAAGRRASRAWWVDRLVERSNRAIAYYGLSDLVQRVPRLSPEHFPDGDVVMATSWPTALPVAEAPLRCGRRVYFIQGYEAFEPGLEPAVDATWRLGLEKIVIASWLQSLARDRFGAAVWGPVTNGVSLEQFHGAPRRRSPGPLVVGMLYELQKLKGLEDGLTAVEIARRNGHEVQLSLFGRYRLRHPLRPGDRYVRNPPQESLAALYGRCDVFLSPSWTEGCQLPPMEAMACGLAVVATEVGGIPDYAVPGVTVLTATPRQPEVLAAHLEALAGDEDRRMELAERGQQWIRRFTWERATVELEQILYAIRDGQSAASVPSLSGS